MTTQTEIMKARPLAIAAKLSKDEELMQDINTGAEAKNYVRRGPMIVLHDLRRILGDDIKNMPVPGSEGGNNPDLYPIEGSKRKGSYYADLFDLFSVGAAIKSEMDKIKLARDVNTASQSGEYEDLDEVQLDEAEDKLKKRRTYGRGVLTNAAALHFKLLELQQLSQISIVERRADDGTLSDSAVPYLVRNADIVNYPNEYKLMSCDTILKIDVGKVLDKGGTFKALKASLKRDKGDDNKIEVPAMQIETASPYVERFGQMLDRVLTSDATEARLIQYLNSEAGQADLIWYTRVEKYLGAVLKSAGLRQKAAKLEVELEDKTEADAAKTAA